MRHIFLFARTGKHMARMPKMASKKISLARGIHCCPNLFILPDQCLYIVQNMFIHTYIHLTAWIFYMNYRCDQTILRVQHFYTNRSGAKFWLDIYHWGVGLAVTGRIRDIGQNALQSSFQTGSGSSPIYCQIFLLVAFLDEDFIGNKI
jgi:hypothetical protein